MYMIRICVLLCGVLLAAGCWMQHAHEQDVVVINVLDKSLYKDCHIPGSIQVDFDKVEAQVRTLAKDHPIVVYCSNYTCMTSHFVVKQLLEKGYTNARVYIGGMAAWFQAGYPVEGPAKSPYLHKEIKLVEENSDELPVVTTKELAELLKIVYNRSDIKRAAA